MNGGPFVLEVAHDSADLPGGAQAALDFEDLIDLNRPIGWQRFARQTHAQRRRLRALLEQVKADGRRVVGYGAAAGAMTMLNVCGVTRDLVAAMGDANPRKQGLLCPGVRMPVVSPDDLTAMNPEYILIGAWTFQEEIIRTFRETMGYRGKFIIPLPMPAVV
ncbi:MAG: methyltransferase C-terminal domain-containing protein [Planctomycetota bacterium]